LPDNIAFVVDAPWGCLQESGEVYRRKFTLLKKKAVDHSVAVEVLANDLSPIGEALGSRLDGAWHIKRIDRISGDR
jgi:hypothetical protein